MDSALQSQKQIGSQIKAVRQLSKTVDLQSSRWCEAAKVHTAHLCGTRSKLHSLFLISAGLAPLVRFLPVQTASTAIKELGDFQNYFEVLQREAAELADLLEKLAEQQSQQQPAAPAGQQS